MSNSRIGEWAKVAIAKEAPWADEVRVHLVEFVKELREKCDGTSYLVDASRLPNLGHLLALVHVSDAVVLLEFCVAYLANMLQEAREHERATKDGGVS
jgi:hypothetical protein